MRKIIIRILIAIVCVAILAVLTHLTANYLIPFIKDMHSGVTY